MAAYARNASRHHGLLKAWLQPLPKPLTIDALAPNLREVLNRGAGTRSLS